MKSGCKIDPTLTESKRRTKKKITFQIAKDRKVDEISEKNINMQSTEIVLIKKNKMA